MQTKFTLQQLADPDTASSEQILRKCVHCGFCTATCPTYVLLGDELDSPRGRIYLIKEMLENERAATAEVVQHVDRCLSCLACMTTCPSGVHYQHLIDHARAHVEKTYRRPWPDRILRAALAAVLPYPARFRAALRLASLARPAGKLLPRRLRSMLALVPSQHGHPARPSRPSRPARSADPPTVRRVELPGEALEETPWERANIPAHRGRRARVALLSGCVQSVIAPRINAAAERLLTLAGAEVVAVPGCCGAIVHHLGRDTDNRQLAKTLIGTLHEEIDAGHLDAIVVTASGCGTHAKDYGYIFRSDAEMAPRAAAVSERVRDIVEILDELGLPAPSTPPGLDIAYHSACSMQHGQKIERQPRALLAAAGFVVKEVAEGHLCCGSAGTYNLLQPELAERLRDRKLENIERTAAHAVATGNIGCITQLSAASSIPVVHTVELLDWAMGGPRPAALAG